MKPEDMNATAMRIFVAAGVVLVAMLLIAQHLIIGFVPPPSPQLSAQEIANIFITRKDRILAGCVLQVITWSFYGIWATPIVMFIRKTERSWPMFTFASLINLGCCSVFFILVPMTWAVIAYRAETLDPAIIQIMNDWVWFDWLYTWPPYSVWMFILSAAILLDRNSPTIYPRWVGYYNLWSGILIITACTIWMVIMSVTTWRAIGAEERLAAAVSPPHLLPVGQH